MAIVIIDGKRVNIANPTPENIMAVKNAMNGTAPQKEATDTPPEKSGILNAVWEDLKTPEKMSREGLTMLTDKLTPSREDIEAGKVGLGGIAARTAGETLSEVAPSFVSRGSIVAGGLLRAAPAVAKAVKPGAKWLARQAEGQSGLVNKGKELLTEAYEDPTLMFGPGIKAANKMYDDIQGGAQQIRPDFKYTAEPIKFIKKAMKAANNGSLSTDEALEARHYLDNIKDSVTGAFYRNARGVLDYIAKADYSGADKAYQRAVQSEALRSLSSFNKSGTPSIGRDIAMFFKPATAVAFSPAVQAGVASTAGAAAKGVKALARNHTATTGAVGIADNIAKLMTRKERPDPEFKKLNGKILERKGKDNGRK